MERNRARLLPPGERNSAVETPQRRQLRIGNLLAQNIRRTPERGTRLRQVVLQEPGLRQRRAGDELILASEGARAYERVEDLGGLGASSSLQSRICTGDYRLNCLSGHLTVYKVYILGLTV